MSYYINNRFGLVSKLYMGTSKERKEPALKAEHCIDVREALPFQSRSAAEKAYRGTYLSNYWYCILSSTTEEKQP